jgi:hypothetical protein
MRDLQSKGPVRRLPFPPPLEKFGASIHGTFWLRPAAHQTPSGAPKDWDGRINAITHLPSLFVPGDLQDGDMVAATIPPHGSEDRGSGCTECLLTGAALRHITATPGFPSPPRRPARTAFELRTAAYGGGGGGMFATDRIPSGELVASEQPFLCVPEYHTAQLDEAKLRRYSSTLRDQIVRRRLPGRPRVHVR